MKKLAFLLTACFTALYSQPVQPETIQRIASNGVYHAMRTFGSGVYDPAAGSAGKTFVTWSGPGMDVYARAYDHASNTWEASVLVENNSCTVANCYHNYPVMIMAPDGRVRIVRFTHDSEGYILKPPSNGSINGTWTRTTFLPGSASPGYPTAVTAGNSIYIFYRQKVLDIYRTLAFVKSTDGGSTWSSPRTVIDTGDNQSDNLDEVYPDDIGYEAAVDGRPARIRITWHLAGGAAHNEKTKNAYFAYLRTADDGMYSVNGTALGQTIDSSDFSNQDINKIRVATVLPTSTIAQAVDASRMPARQDANGNPVVGYNRRISTVPGAASLESYRAYWDGANWQNGRFTIGGAAVTGRLMDFQYVSSTTMRALFSVNDTAVRAISSTNGGVSWSSVYSLSISGELINGADALTHVNVVERPGYKIQAVAGTTQRSALDTDYSGKWSVFVIRD